MTPETNPLDQLKDIHLPEQINQFQLAPGWWILIALAVGLSAYGLSHWLKKRRALYLLKPANLELNQLASRDANSQTMAELSGLLKRICLIYFPKKQVAALSGEQWVSFLNQQAGQTIFSDHQKQLFSQLAYQADQSVAAEQWQAIIDSSRIAIDKIVRQQAKRNITTHFWKTIK